MRSRSSRGHGALELLDEFQSGAAAGNPAAFEEFLALHPEHAEELRTLFEDYCRSAGLLARLGTDEAERVLFEAAAGAPALEDIDLEELCRQHAGLASRLRELHDEATAARARMRESIGEPAIAQGPIAERFTPLSELGRGGMSIVLAAWDSKLRRKVALKCLRPGLVGFDDPARRSRREARLLHEAQVLAQLDHPGIVPVYDVVRDRTGAPFVAMLRVRGVDLRAIYQRHWQRDAAWPLPRVVSIIHRICEALAYAHGRGVLHRDLKPANVMVGSFGEAYLMDWGLARTGHGDEAMAGSVAEQDSTDAIDASISIVHTDREIDDRAGALLTQRGEVLGTPSYMSPEQADGQVDTVGPRSDVYGVGAMVYELLAGHAPYAKPDSSSSSSEILSALRAAAPPALSVVAPTAPMELVAIAEKAMARDPVKRFASMHDLAEDLRAYLEGRVVRAHRTGAFIELRKWIGRHRGLAAALLALFVTLGIGLVSVFGLLRDSERNLYLSRIAQAATSFEAGRFAEMRSALHECGEQYRDWEWGHLLARSDDCVWHAAVDETAQRRLPVASDCSVHHVAVSSDGVLVAVAHRYGVIRLLDARDGSPQGELVGHASGVTSVTFLPTSPLQLLSASWDRTVKLWDVGSRRVVRQWLHDEEVPAIASDRTGSTVVSCTRSGRIHWIDPSRDGFVRRATAHRGAVTALAFAPDGQLIASAGLDLTIAIWNAATGELVRRIERSMSRDRIGDLDVLVHGQPIHGLAFHATGNFLFSASTDGFGKMWDIASGELLFFEPMGHPLGQMAVSPDGKVLAIGGTDLVRLRNALDGRPIESLRGHVTQGGSIAFGPDSELLVAGAADGSVRAYQLGKRGGAFFFSHHPQKVWSVAVSGDRTRLAASYEDGTVRVFRSSNLELIHTIRAAKSRIRRAALDTSGRRVATASDDRTLRVFDVASGRELGRCDAPGRARVWWQDRSLVVIGDSETVLVLSDESLTTQRELRLGARASSIALGDRGRIAVGDTNGAIRVFDSAVEGPIEDLVAHPRSPVTALTFLRDGTLVSAGGDNTIDLWSLPTARRLQRTTGVSAIDLIEGASGRRLLACPSRGNPRLLHRDDLRTLIELVGHEPGLFLCGIVGLGDGRFVTGDSAGALRVWSEQSLRNAR